MGAKLKRARRRIEINAQAARRHEKILTAGLATCIGARRNAEAELAKLKDSPLSCFRGEAWRPHHSDRQLAITMAVSLDEMAMRICTRPIRGAYPYDVSEPIRYVLMEMSDRLLRGILDELAKNGMPGSMLVV